MSDPTFAKRLHAAYLAHGALDAQLGDALACAGSTHIWADAKGRGQVFAGAL